MTTQTAVDVPSIDDDLTADAAAAPRRERLRRELRFAAPIVGLTLGIKAAIYAYGVLFSETVDGSTFSRWIDRFEIWHRWDGVPYLQIADTGYITDTKANATHIVFFPGYPMLVRAFHWVLPGGFLTSALVVSAVASIAAALLIAYLVRFDTGDAARAQRASWFLLIFPTAYFLHLPYTEGLFLTFVLGSFYAARTGHWATAGVLGALAAITRLNGILLVPALAVEAYLQYRQHRRIEWRWLSLAVVPVGTLIYLGINQHVFGDPMHFQEVQNSNWYKHYSNPFTSVKNMINGAATWTPVDRFMNLTAELGFLALGLVASIVAFFKLRPSYAVWGVLNIFLFASTSWIQSSPRYVLTIFPIFLLLASIDRQVWLSRLVSAWSLMWMTWLAGLFAIGHWGY